MIKRGSIKADLPAPTSKAEGAQLKEHAAKLLKKREYKTSITAEEVGEVLLVARWFRLQPQELANVVRLD